MMLVPILEIEIVGILLDKIFKYWLKINNIIE
jgi:hypothetical protein